jgi:hypothetical protein
MITMVWALLAPLTGGILIAAAVPKLRDSESLLRAVRGYRLLPAGAERAVARLLPYAESAAGVLLVAGVMVRYAAAAACLMFLAFCTGLTVNLLRGRRELDCGCFAFGSDDDVPHIGWFHALRALALALAAGVQAAAYEGTGLAGHVLGVALAALLLAVVFALAQVRLVVHPGRRTVDTHLARAADALRNSSASSAASAGPLSR